MALTGTPGVGKSAVVPRLRRRGVAVFPVDEFLAEPGVVTGTDRRRGSKEVDLRALSRAVARRLRDVDGPVVVEGHLAHHVEPATDALVLRLNPRFLARRLLRRGWEPAKVRENVEAEAIDLILQEAVARFGRRRTSEMDVTGLRRHEVARQTAAVVARDGRALKNVQIGRINWTAEILRWY